MPNSAGRSVFDPVEEVVRTGIGTDGKPWRRRYIVCRNEAEAQRDKVPFSTAKAAPTVQVGLDKVGKA